jgi:hypothetical protein
MARGARGRSAAAAQELLDPPILERMERNYREPPAWGEQPLSRSETAIEFAELVIDSDPQRLKRPRCRVLPRLRFGYRGARNLGEFGGAPNRLPLSCRNNGARDTASKTFFAEVSDQFGELGLRQCLDEFPGGLARAAHPHVEGPIKAKGETPLGCVELRRRDAQIEGNAGNRAIIYRSEQSLHLAEPAFEDLQAPAVTLSELAPAPRRIGIAVDTEDATPRRGKQCLAITAAAKGAIDIDGIVTRRQRLNDDIDKNRNVRGSARRLGPVSPRCL